MRHRNYLAIGGFTLALLSTTVLAGHAFAQKGESMQPLSGWSSTSVSNKGSASYCAVARRFDGNVILTIARNKREETSLALDFDQGGFARDNVFGISLDPGAGEQRSLTVKPASEKAFVFKLGKDEAFYNALVKTGFLRTEISGQNYNFNLSDIDSGKEKLVTCLSQIGMPVADAGAVPPSSGAAVAAQADSSANGEKLEDLSRRLARLETENNRLRSEAAAPAVTVASAAGSPKTGMTPEMPPVERVALKPLNDAIEREPVSPAPVMPPVLSTKTAAASAVPAVKAAPQAPVLAAASAPASAVSPPSYSNNSSVTRVDPSVLVGMAEENRKLKALLAEKSGLVEPAQLAQLNDRLKTLEKENKVLAATSTGDTRTIARLSAENDRLASALSAIQTAAGEEDSTAGEVQELQDKLAALTHQNSQYAVKIAAYEVQVSALEEELAAPKKVDNTDYTAAIAALKQQVADARAENEILKAGHAAKAENSGPLQAELTTLKGQVKGIQSEKETLAAKVEGVQAEKEALAAKVAGIQSEKETLAAKMEGVQAEKEALAAKVAGIQSEKETLAAKMEGVQAEKESLAAKVESIQAQAAQIAALEEKARVREAEVETLRLTLDDLKQENESLKQAALDDKAETSEAALNLADMQDKLEKLTLENEGLHTELKQSHTAQSDIEALKSANVELASLLDDAGALTASQQEDIAAQQKKIEALSLQIEEGGHKETAALEEQIKALGEENKALKDDLGVAQIELISLKQNAGEAVSRELETALNNVPEQEVLNETDVKENDPAAAAQDGNPTALISDITEGSGTAASSPEAQNISEVPRLSETAQPDEENGAVPAEDQAAQSSGQDTVSAAVETVPAKEPEMALVKAPIPTFKPPYIAASVAAPVRAPAKAEDITEASGEMPVSSPAQHDVSASQEAASGPRDLNEIETASGDSALAAEDLLGLSREEGREEDAGLSEAQRQEKILSREMDERGDAGHTQAASVKETAPDEADEAVMAAVPAADGAIETENLSAPADAPDEDNGDTASSGEGVVLARLSDGGDSSAKEGAVQASEAVDAATDAKTKREEKSAPAFTPSLPIETILGAAHIPVEGSVKLLADMSGADFYAYQWHSQGGLFGSAQQKPVHGEAEFDSLVQAYLSKTEARCQGEFAIDPSSTQETGGTRIDTYEIACIGGGTDSSASLLFVSQGGTFTVVAHESPTAGMSTAMDYRDRLVESLRKS